MVTLTINGKVVQAEKGEYLLAVIRRMGIDVPALCHHEAVEPYGGCRLCMVEITKESWNGWKNHVTACLYPAEQDLIVSTHSDTIIELRKSLLDLFLARNPHTPLIQKLAAEHGLTKTTFEVVPEPNDCILCGICTRVCDEMGFSAISMVNRGHGREVAPPLHQPPPACVGCLACAQACPTRYIKYEDNGATRKIWDRTFELLTCEKTGRPTITREFAEYLSEHRDLPKEYFRVNDESHRGELVSTMAAITRWSVTEEKK
ncbi:MAG: 2Fe-2S iron-sulfur cluster-binding protein [candidate division Zixibacteria bacterium]|jgi:NADH dehydrogenase/NADH:ubiquinone oxidoreductase subunit G|nr:2Fe-2S iron-sulfur cluster-binding protein [candidate division Zixibacteria bacterium]